MELSVVIEPTSGKGFRATSGEPMSATVVGATKTEALHNLREVLTDRLRAGAEVVRLQLETSPRIPVWPEDTTTQEWLAGIAAAKVTANLRLDSWDTP